LGSRKAERGYRLLEFHVTKVLVGGTVGEELCVGCTGSTNKCVEGCHVLFEGSGDGKQEFHINSVRLIGVESQDVAHVVTQLAASYANLFCHGEDVVQDLGTIVFDDTTAKVSLRDTIQQSIVTVEFKRDQLAALTRM